MPVPHQEEHAGLQEPDERRQVGVGFGTGWFACEGLTCRQVIYYEELANPGGEGQFFPGSTRAPNVKAS